MRLPFSKEDDGKRMMMSGTSTGRKELIYEHRETSLVGGNGVQRRNMVDIGVQFRSNMDLGSGDTSDFQMDDQSNYAPFIGENRFNIYRSVEPSITETHIVESSSTPPPPISPSIPRPENVISTSSESINDGDHFFKVKANKSSEAKNSTLAVVEDKKQPSFTSNESNPTVPSPTEPSKTSTLRLTDRTRSESEDDIEKMDDPEQDGTIIAHKTIYKAAATTENSPNSEKIDKNGNRSENQQNEADNDCIVQCLYYTIQCCECIIL